MAKKKEDKPVPKENIQPEEEGVEKAQDETSPDDKTDDTSETKSQEYHTIQLSGMYENWFLDYASYVILERAVPNILDGLKPVQRRILHSMKDMDDGRFNKVANGILRQGFPSLHRRLFLIQRQLNGNFHTTAGIKNRLRSRSSFPFC